MPVFNAENVPLQNSNLVEAGAGTGKTYSIALLTLRLILEKEIPINKILMVTFTKAAAAELESRIRKFVRIAANHANGNVITDDPICGVVNGIGDMDKAKTLLNEALWLLDETSICTIHSFCQQTLTEYAFETGQIFGSESLENLSECITDEVNDFWRREVSVIESKFLKVLREVKYKSYDWLKYLSRDTLVDLIKQSLGGKAFYMLPGTELSPEEYQAEIERLDKEVVGRFEKNREAYISRIKAYNGNRYTDKTRNDLIARLGDANAFVDYLRTTNAQHVLIIFDDEIKWLKEKENERNNIPIHVINTIFKKAVDTITPKIKQLLLERNQLSFDNLIQNLHHALNGPGNNPLVGLMQERYDAVFIDEFQDTDKYQYDIFNKLFGEQKILFYIGDPKQAIYSFRKADINTYFNARNDVGENIYTMDTNYRSTAGLVSAFNEFFGAEGLDPFANTDQLNRIDYINVNPCDDSPTLELQQRGNTVTPMVIYNGSVEPDGEEEPFPNDEKIRVSVLDLVCDLLKNGQLGEKNVAPNNIAILVRKNSQGRDLKKDLEALNIPAIIMDDEKIFRTEEATLLLYFLEAITSLSINNIKKALLTKFTGYNSADMKRLNADTHVALFKLYAASFKKDGVYACINHFVSDYKVKEHLLNLETKGGQRILANLLQLAEALQQVQKSKRLDETELTSFLKKAINGMPVDGDEFVQRLESDQGALKIVSIHKSKGLEYDIVIAPFLDMDVKTKMAFSSFRNDNEDGIYQFTTNKAIDQTSLAYFEQQTRQENCRLIYVAITRAKYNCFLFKNDKETALSPFMNALQNGTNNVKVSTYQIMGQVYQPAVIAVEYNYPELPEWKLKDANWCKMSYSFLSGQHTSSLKESSKIYATRYDQFIFGEFERGANAGNLLHSIFEFIDFTHMDSWAPMIEKSLNRYLRKKKEEYSTPLQEFVDIILNTPINIGDDSFCLSAISNTQKCNELEFDINLPEFKISDLAQISDENHQISTINTGKLYGILNGKMDLFFEHQGKYYILDWKSNYLGDSLDNYTPEKLNDAMNENNYHLQYLIYTLAAKKFLQGRLPQFDYEKDFGGVIYLFVRGMRKDKDTGIFYQKPSLDQLNLLEEIFAGEEAVANL